MNVQDWIKRLAAINESYDSLRDRVRARLEAYAEANGTDTERYPMEQVIDHAIEHLDLDADSVGFEEDLDIEAGNIFDFFARDVESGPEDHFS